MSLLQQNGVTIPNQAMHHLTDKQIRYLSARAEGKSKVEAKKLAGYPKEARPSTIEQSPALRSALNVALEREGITDESLAKKLKSGLESEKLLYATFEGKITDFKPVPDNENQRHYLKTILEVRGDLQDKTEQTVNLGIITVPSQVKANEWNAVTDKPT